MLNLHWKKISVAATRNPVTATGIMVSATGIFCQCKKQFIFYKKKKRVDIGFLNIKKLLNPFKNKISMQLL